jgi:hypothetical protein
MLFGVFTGSSSWGLTLHYYLFLAGLWLAAGPAVRTSVGLFAEERRQQTLELLYLTGMGSGELFVGKLLGGVLVSSGQLLALAPLVAVPFLSGGLSFNLFVATVACLPTVFILMLSLGSLASALCRQEGTALLVTIVFVCAAGLALPLPYNLGFWLTGAAPFDKSWLRLSLALGPWMVAKNFAGFRVSDFWVWTASMWGLSAGCLAMAAVILKRNWRRDLEGAGRAGWQARWEKFVIGGAARRAYLRRRLLAVNAYQWLAQQDRRPVFLLWVFIALVCAFWLLGWCLWRRSWVSLLNFYTTAAILLAGCDLLIAHAAARRMTADRQDGALELLLTTPLRPEEMLAGQKAALREQCAPVKRSLLGLLALMVLAGFLAHDLTIQGMVSYLAVWCVFFLWCCRSAGRSAPRAMWVAANCGRPLYGIFRSGGALNQAGRIYWLFIVGNWVGALGKGARSFPSGSTTEMIVVVAVVVWVLVFMFAVRNSPNAMVEPLIAQLRSIAQEPLPELNDPRFKAWKDIRTRFPAPPGGRHGLTHTDLFPPKPIKASGAWFWPPLGRISGRAWGKMRRRF